MGPRRLSGLKEQRQAAEFRNREIGYVWQFHYLLPEFTAEENVAMPLLARGMRLVKRRSRAKVWLGEVGAGGPGGASVRRVEWRGAAAGEPGAGAGDGAAGAAGG